MKLSLVMLCFFLIPEAVFAADLKPIRLNTIEVPPFYSESKPEQGAASVATKEQFKKIGYALEYQFMPFARAKFEALKNTDTIGYAPCSEADLIRGFVLSKTLFTTTTILIQRKDSPIVWNSAEDLKKYRGGHVVGYSLKGRLKDKKLAVENTADDVANLIKLGNKRIDFVLLNDAMYSYLIKTNPTLRPFADQFQVNEKPIAKVHWGIAFKSTPKARNIMEQFNAKVDVEEFKKSIQTYLAKNK